MNSLGFLGALLRLSRLSSRAGRWRCGRAHGPGRVQVQALGGEPASRRRFVNNLKSQAEVQGRGRGGTRPGLCLSAREDPDSGRSAGLAVPGSHNSPRSAAGTVSARGPRVASRVPHSEQPRRGWGAPPFSNPHPISAARCARAASSLLPCFLLPPPLSPSSSPHPFLPAVPSLLPALSLLPAVPSLVVPLAPPPPLPPPAPLPLRSRHLRPPPRPRRVNLFCQAAAPGRIERPAAPRGSRRRGPWSARPALGRGPRRRHHVLGSRPR